MAIRETEPASGDREELLALLLAEEGFQPVTEPVLAHRDRPGAVPLSFAQQRLWLFDQIAPGNPAYNVAVAVRMEGPLDQEALAWALAEVVRRHEALRTVFHSRRGEPIQVVLPIGAVPLPVVDLTTIAPPRAAAAQSLLVAETIRPFDLANGPLLRVMLLRLARQEHIFLAAAHHIVADGWSMGVLTEELTALYAAHLMGRSLPLPPLPLQYADYALWQRQWMAQEEPAAQLSYWQRRLAGELPALALPQRQARQRRQTFAGATQALTVGPELARRLAALAREEGTTLFGVLLASFSVLLCRYGSQPEVVVGTPVAGRSRPELERLIGCFVNTLALRQDLSADPSFRQLLAGVGRDVLEALAHQDVPFERVVEAVQPERRANQSPLFQALLVLQNAPAELPRLGGLRLTRLPIDPGTAKFDLTLKVEEEPGGALSGLLEYNTDLFSAATIEALAGHWLELLAGAADDSGRRVSQLPLVSAEELYQRGQRWNAAAAVAPAPLVHEMIARQAHRQPQALALIDSDRRLSYGDLEGESNRLANLLQGRAVGTDDRVVVLLDRSADQVVSLLAALKSGAAYVPLDPELPPERLAAMLWDAEPAVLITTERWLEKLPPVLACQLILLDSDSAEIAGCDDRQPSVLALPESLAYVIYTSGSTGTPKGVGVSHRALATYVQSAIERLGLDACSSFALVSTPAADLGHTVLFPSLATGGRLLVVDRKTAADAGALAERFTEEEVDCLKIVPSHLAALLQVERPEALLPRRCLVLGGEQPSGDLVRRVLTLSPALQVFNHYGPTETTVGVITHALAGVPAPGTAVPLDTPLAGVAIHVLDRAGEPVPAEVIGELYVGGHTLARGYLAMPEATAAAFVPDPFAGSPGDRLYRTGDLARLRPDGALDIVGRADRQVKIRGFRVELGEIESILLQHPAVSQGAAVFHRSAAGNRRLVAYVAGRNGSPPAAEELRRHLAERLPDYMVPGLIVPLPALPLNANGKLDRGSLPSPEALAEPAAEEVESAPTPVEEVLCSIWAKVLGVRRISPHDNFFDLGGHSVLATQVMARIQEAFQMELPVLSLFELPTVAGLARRIELGMKAAPALQMSAPGPMTRPAEPPLSFAQQRLWFLHRLEPDSTAYNMAGMVHASGRMDVAALTLALNEIVRRHEVLRTTFHQAGGRPLLRLCPELPLAVPQISLERLDAGVREPEARRLAAAEAQRPFDLERGPLLRATLIRFSSEEVLLLLTMNHIASDGWSVGVILRELAALYEAFSRGLASPLPALPLQYADFAIWQRQWLQGPVLESQLSYWRRQLSGLAPVIALPTDRPHPPLQTSRGARVAFAIEPRPIERLKELSRETDATLFMTLLGVFATLLHRYSGQDDFAVGSPIAGRNHRELEGLVGFFVNTLALRVSPAPQLRFTDLLGRLREAALGAYAHQDLPFEHLVESMEGERDLSRPPLFQTMFVWQNVPTPLARLSGLDLVPLEADTHSAKFELTLSLQEMPDAMLGSLEYNTDLFDASTVERLASHFQNLLAAAGADPGSRLSDLAWANAAEFAQAAAFCSSPQTLAADPYGDFCALVSAQAARTPRAVAIGQAERRLTYEELEGRADRLARRLCERGAGPETLVALAAERGIELTVMVLAVLKTGAAYLPLDPRHPAARQLDILARSGVSLLLAGDGGESLVAGAVEGVALPPVLLLDEALATADADWPFKAPADPRSLAYVIYTSGSTGQPKGVMIERRGMLNHLFAKIDVLALGARDVVAQTASQCFDISVWQLLAALLVGGRVEIVGDEIAHDPARLLAEIDRLGVTVFETVPSLLQAMLASLDRPGAPAVSLSSLRWLIPTGEALPASLCRDWLRRFSDVPLLNAYGPTECSDDVSHQRIVTPPDAGERVPIGRAIANLRLYVLDGETQPQPLGVAGELCVGGVGVGRGYLGDPALTARAFAPDPQGEPGARLYRTGDRVRRRPDGAIEFLSRQDDQVKIRGLRVEPGEIAATLLRHPALREAVVVAYDEPTHGRRLIAYVVGREPAAPAPAPAELRAFLQASLPDYMVPAGFVQLAALPLTANGKLDRRALPEPTADLLATGLTGRVAPRMRLESQLLEIWQEALGIPEMGITDDFFTLGGHSLLAVRLMALIEERLGVALPLASLFRGATVEHLAHLIATRPERSPWSPLVPIQPDGDRLPLFCVHPTGGDVLCYHPLARLLGPEQPLYGLQARGLEAGQSPFGEVPEMAACYLAALREVQPHGPYRLAGWSFGGVVAYEIARQLASQGQEVELLAILDSLAPIGAGEGDAAPLTQVQWASWFVLIAREFGQVFRQDLALDVEELRHLAPEAQLRAFVERLRRVDFLPPGAGLSIAESFWRIHEANTVALWRYAAAAGPYAGPLTLVRSAEPLLLEDSWDRASHAGTDLGWGRLCSGRLTVHEVPGNHNTLLRSPNVEVLAERLAAGLGHRQEGQP